MNLTVEMINSVISYNPETGEFLSLLSGKILGQSKKESGRLLINIKGKTYIASRLAWFLITGDWPKGVIDHINRDPYDNRFVNLRDVSGMENSCNRAQGNGVHKRGRRWRVLIKSKNKYVYKSFLNYEEALEFRRKMNQLFYSL